MQSVNTQPHQHITLIGAGIMSATLGILLKELNPNFNITIYERLPGILITTLLLSAGAPFWQDVLQSLFGLKALLRKPENSGARGATLGAIR